MPAPENPKVGGCYIWVISFLLFVFTVSGAVFLLLYVTQPASPATTRYACIGVSLVFLPWFFWILTFLYRVISRCCGFRMNCFGSSGSGHPNDDKNGPAARAEQVSSNNAAVVPISSVVDEDKSRNDVESGVVNETRRVHFGGVVILGEEDEAANVNDDNHETVEVLSRSSSSSSASSRDSNESEKPLRLSMA